MKLRLVFACFLSIASLPVAASADDYGDDFRKAFKRLACSNVSVSTFQGTIAEAAAQTPELSRLLEVVVLADTQEGTNFVEILSDPNADLTVFAPVNNAFDILEASGLLGAVSDNGLVGFVLSYHILEKRLPAGRIKCGLSKPRAEETAIEQDVFLVPGRRGPTVNNSNIAAIVKTDNGTVAVIDSVLTPQVTP